MYLQELLEVAIGLVFVYLLLSLACMQVQEWLASYFRWRADNLEDGLREMLADDALSAGWRRMLRKIPILKQILKALGRWPSIEKIIKPESVPGWVDTLYDHPLIRSLAQPGTKPSYIPAQNFAQVLFDIVMTAGTEASVIQQTLYSLRAKVRNLSKVSEKDRIECERVLNIAISQAAKLIDLSRPGKIGLSNYEWLRDEAWKSLKDQLTFLGVNTTETWTKPPHILAIRDNSALGPILRRQPEFKKNSSLQSNVSGY